MYEISPDLIEWMVADDLVSFQVFKNKFEDFLL